MLLSLFQNVYMLFGLVDLLRDRGRANLEAWRKANPDYKLKLWIDSGLFEGMPRVKKSWKDWLKFKSKKIPDNYPQAYQDLIRWAQEHKITICDLGLKSNEVPPGLHGVVKGEKAFLASMKGAHYYNDEINGQYKNYAAASDILRLNILHREGGVYFDCEDVLPSDSKLGSLTATAGVLLHVWEEGGNISNDLIAAVPENHFVRCYMDLIVKNYDELYRDPLKLYAHRNSDFTGSGVYRNDHSRLQSTIYTSGPVVLNKTLNKTELTAEELAFPEALYMTPNEGKGQGSWYDANGHLQFAYLARNHIRTYFLYQLEQRKKELTDPAYSIELRELEKLVQQLHFNPEFKIDTIFSKERLGVVDQQADYPPYLKELLRKLTLASQNIENFITHVEREIAFSLNQSRTPKGKETSLGHDTGSLSQKTDNLIKTLLANLTNIGSRAHETDISLNFFSRGIQTEEFVEMLCDPNFMLHHLNNLANWQPLLFFSQTLKDKHSDPKLGGSLSDQEGGSSAA